MGLRCLLGHDYGESHTEREREERGDELVVTVTEVEECTRCGDTRVVSENTEVTSLSTPSEPDGTTPPRAGQASTAGGETTATEQTPDPTEAVVDEDVEVVIDDADGGFDGPAESTGEQTIETDHPATDDAEILDGDPPESETTPTGSETTPADDERGRGEWAGSDTTHPADAAETEPTVGDAPETTDTPGTSQTPDDAGAEIVDANDTDTEIIDADDTDTEIVDANDTDTETIDASASDTTDIDAGDPDTEIIDADTDESDTEIVDADGSIDDADTEIIDADAVSDDEPTAGTEPSDGTDTPPTDREPPVVDDAEIVEGPGGEDAEIVDETRPDESPAAREARSDVVNGVEDDAPSPTDDAEIVDGTGDWPTPDGEDRGYDAEPDDDDGEVSVDGLQPDAELDPESLVDDETEFVGGSPSPTGPASNGASANGDGSTTGVNLSTTHEGSAGEYFCPKCGHAETVGQSSMRKGDICPECMRGYIDERVAE